MSGLGRHSRGTIRERGSERYALCEFRLIQAARRFGSGRDKHHNYSRRGSLQAQGAEGDPVGYTMELILMSTAGTATLFLLQFMDFVRGYSAAASGQRHAHSDGAGGGRLRQVGQGSITHLPRSRNVPATVALGCAR
jgi:hypothetical protein